MSNKYNWLYISLCVLIVSSGDAFSSDFACPKSKIGFVVGTATSSFVKNCLGIPSADQKRGDKRFYLYEVDEKTVTAMGYMFDSSEKLLQMSVRSTRLNKADAENLMARKEGYKNYDDMEKQELAERNRQYEKDRVAAEHQEQERLKRESALPAQAMYLQAGKYDRNGQQSDAVRLYELLIEKFPNHALAVQANNRLVGIRSGNEASNRADIENSQASAECGRRKEAYRMSCGDDWQCYERAKSICSE